MDVASTVEPIVLFVICPLFATAADAPEKYKPILALSMVLLFMIVLSYPPPVELKNIP
jgi:hypothetical protein